MPNRDGEKISCLLCGRTGTRGFETLDTNPLKHRCRSRKACSLRASKIPEPEPGAETGAEAPAGDLSPEIPDFRLPPEPAESRTWYLIEQPDNPPRCDRLSESQVSALRETGACLTPHSAPPMAVAGETPLIAYQLEDLSFNRLQTEFVIAAVRLMAPHEIPEGANTLRLGPWDYDYENAEPGQVISASDDFTEHAGYKALRYVFALKRPRSGQSSKAPSFIPELVKPGHIEAVSIDKRYGISDNRTIKALPDGLSYRIINYLSNGKTASASVSNQDLHKTHGQSVWHSETLIALDVPTKLLGAARDYLRIVAKNATQIRNRIDGLGPIRVSESGTGEETVIFVGASGSFEIETGKARPDYYSDLRDKPALNIFGINLLPDVNMKIAYAEFFRLGDCCPENPGICLSPVGVLILTPISAIENGYRVPSFTYGASASGKTAYEILLLSTQSPSAHARGYSAMQKLVTVSARPGRGGSTTNGINMVLQYAGGFRALIDDYTTRNMSPIDMAQRASGLSILVGSLEGEAPTKQTWAHAGPDFAQGFAPQSSFAISGEIFPTDLESVINRLLINRAPDTDIKEPGGYDYRLIRELDSQESGDLRNAAFSDLARFTLANPEIVADAYSRAYAITSQWANGSDFRTNGSERMLRRYAIPLAGWIVALERARDAYGLDNTDRIPAIAEALRSTALAQYSMISGSLDLPSQIRKAIREALADRACSIPAPPDRDPESGEAISDWTAPNWNPDSRKSEDVSPDLPLPDFLPSWAPLGMETQTASSGQVSQAGIVPVSKTFIGYWLSPVKAARPPVYPYRVQIGVREQLGVLARLLDRRDGKTGFFTEQTIREALLSDPKIAVKHNSGKPYGTVILINAAWLFDSDSEE